MDPITIGSHIVGDQHPVFIIAEAGVNHNGDLELAKKLIEAAKAAGASAIKFQTFKAEKLNTRTAPKSTYHIETTGSEQSSFDLLKSQELDRRAHEALIQHCDKVGIMFLSTPYDEDSANLLDDFDIPVYKIASTDANNIPFLRFLAQKGRPIILSTAMSYLDEVRESVQAIRQSGGRDLILLHCTANYPAKLEDSNLRAMLTMKKEFQLPVGYSDHNPGRVNPIAAVSLGAVVYEKHFTLDKTLPGPDHRASLDPDELKQLVTDIRNTEAALGTGDKVPVEAEMENRVKLRKSLVADVDITAGTTITREMLAIKRPGSGLEPKLFEEIIGRVAKVSIEKDTLIEFEQFQ